MPATIKTAGQRNLMPGAKGFNLVACIRCSILKLSTALKLPSSLLTCVKLK
jgi:hypothetical protein